MKKVLATVLALVMALALCSVSWADVKDTDVAKIGDIGYATLAEAFANLQDDNNTITVLSDTSIPANTQIKGNVLLDLNGHKVTVTRDGNQSYNAFEVRNNATFSVMDSQADGKLDLGKFGILLYDGKMTLSSGIVTVKPDHAGQSTVVAMMGTSDFTMNGGLLYADGTSCFNPGYLGTQSISISGGTVKCTGGQAVVGCGTAYASVNLNVNIGGSVVMDTKDGNGNIAELISNAEQDNMNASVAVTGGTFPNDVKTYVAQGSIVQKDGDKYKVVADGAITSGTYTSQPTVPSGYKATKNDDGTWTVTKISYYYYPSTSDTTTSTTTKGSPKTFDAGVGIYAVTAVLSVTGMAWAAKKRGN